MLAGLGFFLAAAWSWWPCVAPAGLVAAVRETSVVIAIAAPRCDRPGPLGPVAGGAPWWRGWRSWSRDPVA